MQPPTVRTPLQRLQTRQVVLPMGSLWVRPQGVYIASLTH